MLFELNDGFDAVDIKAEKEAFASSRERIFHFDSGLAWSIQFGVLDICFFCMVLMAIDILAIAAASYLAKRGDGMEVIIGPSIHLCDVITIVSK